MADNSTEKLNFSIEDTMSGVGDTSLVNDLLGDNTNPDDLEEIIKEIPADKKVVKTPPEEKKETASPKTPEDKIEEQNILSSFLEEGEEEGKEEEENAPKETPIDEEREEEVSQFTALSKDLFKLGVFSKEENEEEEVITTPEQFLERFNVEKQKGALEMINAFIGKYGDDYRNAFEAIFVNGMDPREYFNTYNNIVNFAQLDLTKEENQIKVIERSLLDQGMEAEDVSTEIERLKNYGDLEVVAGKHHKALVKKEALSLKEKEALAQEEMQQKTAIKNQWIQNVQQILQDRIKTKEFDGIPINPKLINELQEFLLVDKWKTPNGETLTDFDKTILELKKPENHALKVKVALLLKVLEKDPTLSTIQRSAISKKSEQLFGEVARQVTKDKTSPVKTTRSNWSFNT
jgi:hypothetical protein